MSQNRIAAFLLAALVSAAAIGASSSSSSSSAADRGALWRAVRACLATHAVTGAAFPCLWVDVDEGEERGVAVLRPPFGPPDTILVPTRKVGGVEDPWLLSSEAPNYFEAAWDARRFSLVPEIDTDERQVAVAVNSKAGRSQDQLHIHIGCLAPGIAKLLSAALEEARIGSWKRAAPPLLGAEIWLLRTGTTTLANVNPFRLVGEGPAATPRDRARTMIAVIEPKIGAGREFVILASRDGDGAAALSAEQVVDVSCARPLWLGLQTVR